MILTAKFIRICILPIITIVIAWVICQVVENQNWKMFLREFTWTFNLLLLSVYIALASLMMFPYFILFIISLAISYVFLMALYMGMIRTKFMQTFPDLSYFKKKNRDITPLLLSGVILALIAISLNV